MTTRQYARLVSEWIASIGLDPHLYGTHSLRRTKATLIYRRTGNLRAVQLLLGHTKIESTVRYLGLEVDDALSIAEEVDLGWTLGGASSFRPNGPPRAHTAELSMRRTATPAHPPKSAEKRAQERDTWFDMYPGRAASQRGLSYWISGCARTADIPADYVGVHESLAGKFWTFGSGVLTSRR
jgi:hypothetical protein